MHDASKIMMILTSTLSIFHISPTTTIWPFLWCIYFSAHKICTMLLNYDDFDFHLSILHFSLATYHLALSYGVYVLQLIRYARCCSHYDDFRYRHRCLVDRLWYQGCIFLRLEMSFEKFYGRYQNLIEYTRSP